MGYKKPFTDQEQEVMDLIVLAHSKFIELKQTHPSEINEWVKSVHSCQSVLINRVVRRDYPNTFYTIVDP